MKIIIFENSCQIHNLLDEKIIHQLDNLLSFKIQGAEYSKAFQGYINERGEEASWDGKTRLLTSDLRFPFGLLDLVKEFLTKKNVEFSIEDVRSNLTKASPINILPNLESIGIIPRPYQLEAALVASKSYRGIIRAGTGAGKTAIAALTIAHLGKPAVILVIGTDLLYQFHSFFSKIFNEEIGIIGDGECNIKRINIATIWSVGQALGLKKNTTTLDDDNDDEKKIDPAKFKAIMTMLKTTSTYILDECHLAACDTVQNIAHHVKAEHFFGMSASPWRDDNQDLLIEGVIGRKLIDISAKYLVENDYLVKPIIRFIPVPKLKEKIKKHYQTIYSKYIIENEVRNDLVVKGAQRLVEQGYPTLVLFKNIKHGKLLKEKLSKIMKVEMLSGKDSSDERERVKKLIESGAVKCVVASTIYDIGIDLPILSGLVIAGGGKSSVRALQRVGRVIRKHPGKVQAAVIDFADQAPYLMEHSERRKEILSQEFEVSWPQRKS